MRVRVMATAALVLVAVSATAHAQQDYEKHPGYVDISALGIAGGQEPSVEIMLKGSLLRLLAGAAGDDDPGLKDVVQKLAGISVRVYPLDSAPGDEYEKKADALSKRLGSQGWETIVKVREPGERAYIAVKTVNDHIVGLVVLSLEKDDEIALVNIAGDIDLDRIGELGDDFHLSPLDSARLESRKSSKSKDH
ncbi:MAG: DUF4252 domain-containing protein [Candidatus Zixiibacteriota bacterium]